jgi:hypothetical protein
MKLAVEKHQELLNQKQEVENFVEILYNSSDFGSDVRSKPLKEVKELIDKQFSDNYSER